MVNAINQDRFYLKRLEMVDDQIKARGIQNKKVWSAMQMVPRHLFVSEVLQDSAYEDRPLEIGYGQTISQPYIVAFMTEALEVNEEAKVLEIGTGSGYQSAILSKISKEVYTIEIVKALAEATKALFQQLGFTNIYAKIGNGYQGWPEAAPFDAIMITAAADHIVNNLLNQLKVGGHMVMPLKENTFNQTLIRITKLDGHNHYRREELLPVRFVPLIGQV